MSTETTTTANGVLTRVAGGKYSAKDGEILISLSPKREDDPAECMSTMWSAVEDGTEVARERSLTEMKAAIAALLGYADGKPSPKQDKAEKAEASEDKGDNPAWLDTFLAYAEDAGNWSGAPWLKQGNVEYTTEIGKHVRYAAKQNLLVQVEDAETKERYLRFTERGAALAAEHGILGVEATAYDA
jgi:hypothetical protein